MNAINRDFEIDSFALCDYATADAIGKTILVGVYNGQIRLSDQPSHWFPLVIHLAVSPKVKEFPFFVELIRPNGRKFLKMNASYRSMDTPEPHETFNLNIQLPPAPFTGVGDYKLQAKDQRGEVVFSSSFSVVVAPPLAKQIEINGQVEFDAELIGAPMG
jgi:hypothetical protein